MKQTSCIYARLMRMAFVPLIAAVFTSAMLSSCNFTKEELRSIARAEKGKSSYRKSEKWGDVVTRSIDIQSITALCASGSVDIRYTQGNEFALEAYGNDKAIDLYDICSEDGILTCTPKKDAPSDLPGITLLVTSPILESIEVCGAGDVTLEGDVELNNDLRLSISGAGDIDISNLTCQSLAVAVNGSGDATAKRITCQSLEVELCGAGDVSIGKTECATSATMDISGAGDIEGKLKANDLTLTVSGAGDADLKIECQTANVVASGSGDVELRGTCVNLTKSESGFSHIDSEDLDVTKVKIQ